MRKLMVSECKSLDGVRQAPVERTRIGAAGGAAEAVQVDAVTHGQSSAMEAVIGGCVGRRSHMRRQGIRCRTPKGRRHER